MVIFAFADQIQLLPDLTLFFHIGLILVMIWFLNRTFFRPINKILETRERDKGGGYVEAEGILREVAEKDAEYQAMLLKARDEGYALIEAKRRKALERKNVKMSKVRKEVAEHLESALEGLKAETADAETAIRTRAEEMSDEISSNILKPA